MSRRANRVYILLATLLVLAMLGQTINQIWAAPDFWVNLAAVREFAAAPLHPHNPLVVGNAPDPYLSPYAFALALIVRVTGIRAVSVLAAAGIGNLVLLLVSLRRLAVRISSTAFMAPLTLLFTLAAWGWAPWRWSGFFDLNSIGTVLPLASTFASAVGMLVLAALLDWLRTGRRNQLVVLLVASPLVLLSHPVTSLWVAAVAAAILLSEITNTRAPLWPVVAVAGVAGAVAVAWPFYPVARTLTHASAFDASNVAMYHGLASRTLLALPGFVLIGLHLLRRERDALALGALFNVAIYVVGYALHHDAFGRVLPGIMLMAHLEMARFVGETIANRGTVRTAVARAVGAGTLAVLLVGTIGCASGVLRTVQRALLPRSYRHDHRLASLVAPYATVERIIPRDDVIVASRTIALGAAASSGKLIAPEAPAPFVADIPNRREVVARLLSPRTPDSEFHKLAVMYRVRWFVLTPADSDPPAQPDSEERNATRFINGQRTDLPYSHGR